MIRAIFPPALDSDRKPISSHDPAHNFLGDDGSLAAEQGVYPAIPITPVVFMEKGGDSETISVPGAREGMILTTKCVIRDIECKVINGRKISVKAGVEFCIKLYSNEDVEIINKVGNIEDIQVLQEDFMGEKICTENDNLDTLDRFLQIVETNQSPSQLSVAEDIGQLIFEQTIK